MNNKICGECSWFSEGGNRCKLFINQYIFGDRSACNNFVPKPEAPKPTNGGIIIAGGNRAIAEFQQQNTCDNCVYNNHSGFHNYCDKPVDKTCTDGIEAWLNAPADCVAENGESAKQADFCCKSAKQSEVKDELRTEAVPCPFCGENIWTIYAGCGEDHSVVCENCEAASPIAKSAEDAVKAWNRRPAEDALKAENTRYRRALHNLKEDCTRRKHFAVSDEEKLFLYETISHIDAELDFNTDTGKGGEDEP